MPGELVGENTSFMKFCYNKANKVTQFQPRDLLTSSACSIILWTHANDSMHICKLSMGLEKLKFDKVL